MIVKVQLSLQSSNGVAYMLIYNEDRSVMYETEATEEIKTLMEMRPKAYFEAELDDEKKLIIGKEVKHQKW